MSFLVSAQVTRRIIRKYVSADGVEREEVMVEGGQQEAVTVDEADSFSKVVKRTVVKSGGDQTEVSVCLLSIHFPLMCKEHCVTCNTVCHVNVKKKLQVTFSEPLPIVGVRASGFEVEPVHGRKVSKVVKTMVVQGERMEKQIGDPLLSADLPSAKDDFEKVCCVKCVSLVLMPELFLSSSCFV